MSSAPILLMGGSGAIGRWTTRFLRAARPVLPLLIGGRDLTKAQEAAARMDNAEGAALELAAADLGLGGRPVSAVAVLFSDESLAGLRFAQANGIPHLSISSGIYEIAPEIAAFMHKPDASSIVLGYEWLVGATTVPTLEFAKAFSRVDDIAIGALVDEQDTGGPAVAEDFERLNRTLPAALTRREGRYIWRAGEDAKAIFHAVDGTRMEAFGFSSIDVAGLATVTGAPNVQFNIATGVSSSRRRGEPMSTEIVIELAGQDRAGRALRTRHAVVHREGSAPLTGLGVAMILERLLGLDGHPATPAGLYFPYQLLHPTAYLTRLKQTGGEILTLEAR
ncbi:NAD(P)-dependent oxidoreductase [Pseudoroseomonas wenyumeiae]|uniref:NAD(P)-dependent oxidoreductase n=1 Tax=Teichococcus wenyumeiae TaxID=2478470 RepID=A0A3A9JC72_9PROT|nr:NAD(P)-dependent oxidoreductase [Pseudoroseomonas wenyumeiae]RKK01014.1 NAD(P)-dependent oxidoreductase [Pseudoroseomonas wenyumeiae]RMI15287.1 NAD(P)-dependent oxidoreductase [Pseudoroseomonas wenyumeiae]